MRTTYQAWWVGEALDDFESSVIAVTAGMGSGKTDGASDWLHNRIRQNPGVRYHAYMEPSYQKVMDTAIPTMQTVLGRYGRIENVHYRIVKSPHPKLIYLDEPWKPEIHFLSAEAPKKIAAVQYGCAVEDEAGVNSGEARKNLRTRLYRLKHAKIAQFMVVGAPQGVNEFADEFDSETLEGWDTSHPRDHVLRREVEGKVIKKRRFILHTDDNIHIPEQYIIELQDTYGHNPNLIQSYRYGRFCPLTEKAAFGNYMPQKHDDKAEAFKADPFQDIIMTWDFNAQPLAWVAIQGFNIDIPVRRKQYVALDEANRGATNLDDSCVEFAVKFPLDRFANTPIYLYGDRTGHAASHKVSGSDFENVKLYLTRLGYRHVYIKAQTQVAPEGASVDALNKLFLNSTLMVNPRCKMLRRGLLATKWKDGVRKLDKPSGETHTHHPDAVKYWAWQERNNLQVINRIYGKN